MKLMELSSNTISSHIKTCVKNLTTDQWSLVASGAPDINTTHRLAHMLLKMLSELSGVLSKPGVTMERVQDSVKGSIVQSFEEALRVASLHSPSTDKLAEMIAKEVTDSVKTPRTQTRITPPRRLKAMIESVCKILKACAKKMNKTYYTGTNSLSRKGQKTCQPNVQSVQDIISDEVKKIIEPILDDISDAEYHLLQEVSSLEIQNAADEIAQSVTEAMSLQETEDARPESVPQRYKLLDAVRTKICDVFVKRLIKASMCQIISQVKVKFTHVANITDSQTLRSVLDGVESVMLTGDETQAGGNEVSVFYGPNRITAANMDTVTWEISTLLYKHVTGQVVSHAATEDAAIMVPRRHTNMYLDIRSRVISFLSLINWWLSDPVLRCSESLLTALIDAEKVVALRFSEAKTCDEQKEAELRVYNKFCLRAVILKVFLNILAEVKDTRFSVSDLESKVLRLVDETWAELECANVVDITPKGADRLYKAILRDLRKCCSPSAMLIYMSSGDSAALRKIISVSCRTHLNKQNKSISRNYVSVKQGFANVYSYLKKSNFWSRFILFIVIFL